MARFNPGPLGRVTGQIGNYVVRRMNGKYFVSFRPDTYKVSKSNKAKQSRTGFGSCVKLAKIVSGQPELSQVWKSANITGTSAYHRIIKHNIIWTSEGNLSASNIIVPEGYSNPYSAINFNADSLSVDVNQNLVRKEYPVLSFKAYLIVHMMLPLNKTNAGHAFKLFIEDVDINNSQQILINFSSTDKKLFSQFNRYIIYTTALWTNVKGRIQWSSSSAKEFNLPV